MELDSFEHGVPSGQPAACAQGDCMCTDGHTQRTAAAAQQHMGHRLVAAMYVA